MAEWINTAFYWVTLTVRWYFLPWSCPPLLVGGVLFCSWNHFPVTKRHFPSSFQSLVHFFLYPLSSVSLIDIYWVGSKPCQCFWECSRGKCHPLSFRSCVLTLCWHLQSPCSVWLNFSPRRGFAALVRSVPWGWKPLREAQWEVSGLLFVSAVEMSGLRMLFCFTPVKINNCNKDIWKVNRNATMGSRFYTQKQIARLQIRQ